MLDLLIPIFWRRDGQKILFVESYTSLFISAGKKIKRPEHSPELVCSNSASMASQELIQLTSQEQLSYSSEVQTTVRLPSTNIVFTVFIFLPSMPKILLKL